MFRLGAITTGGKMNPRHFVLYEKNFGWLGGCLRLELRKVGIALAEGLYDWE
jgi:hypothetical protein